MENALDVELVVVRSDDMEDWWTIERAVHEHRLSLASIPGGRPGNVRLAYSGRVADADVEGTREEMLGLAEAIEKRSARSYTRCAVRWHKAGVSLWSPRNSIVHGLVSHARALELAASIRKAMG